jgi:F-type H+-transporting ATPase subunit gamma
MNGLLDQHTYYKEEKEDMGAQLRVYRQKIKSAQTTKKITRAMELISASRIQKAQARVAASGPYSRAVTRAVSAVATFSNVDHILTTEPEKIERAAVVLFTSDRGLAGAFSTNVVRESSELVTLLQSQGKEVVYYLVGRKAAAYFAFRKRAAEQIWTGSTEKPEFETAQKIGETLVAKFIQPASEGGVDEIHIVYNRFVSVVTQVPEVVRLLPLEVVEGVEAPEDNEVLPLYEFEPQVDDVLDALLPVYIESRIFNAMLQSAASEHAARQRAMKSASDNADKLITTFTRLANNARQSEITQQISEIVGGADALSPKK